MFKNKKNSYLIGVILSLAVFSLFAIAPEVKAESPLDTQCCGYFAGNGGLILFDAWILGGSQVPGCIKNTEACSGSFKYYTDFNSPEGKYSGYKNLMPCYKHPACVDKIPNYEANAVNWTAETNVTIPFGETKTFDVTATAGANFSGPVEIKCLVCDPDVTQVTGGNNGQITLKFDSVKHVTKTQASLPVTANYILQGLLQNEKFNLLFYPKFTITAPDCAKYAANECLSKNAPFCFPLQEKCLSRYDKELCSKLNTQDWCKESKVCQWSKQTEKCLTSTGAYAESQYGVPEGYKGALPACAFSGTCDDINDLLQLIVNFGKGMFMIIGSFAFVFFIYGGFTMIFSFGGEEQIKKGRAILVAAVVGLIIALSAYLLIDFMLDAIDVAPEFRRIK